MKRILCPVSTLILALILTTCLGACNQSGGEPPITAVEPGMTMEEVLALEPDLTESGKDGMLHCKRSFGGVEGWLAVNFYDTKSGMFVLNVGWDAEPEENGKKIYRELFSALKSCYGKPTNTAKTKSGDGTSAVVLEAYWNTEDYIGSLTYSEEEETGYCRVLYVAGYTRVAG